MLRYGKRFTREQKSVIMLEHLEGGVKSIRKRRNAMKMLLYCSIILSLPVAYGQTLELTDKCKTAHNALVDIVYATDLPGSSTPDYVRAGLQYNNACSPSEIDTILEHGGIVTCNPSRELCIPPPLLPHQIEAFPPEAFEALE